MELQKDQSDFVDSTTELATTLHGRRVFRGKEHEDIEIPAQLLMNGFSLDLYEEVRKANYFQARFTHGQLKLQAGPLIGFVALNDRVAIEILPKLPVKNLDRLLRLGSAVPTSLPVLQRMYGANSDAPALTEVLADALLESVQRIAVNGRLRLYEQQHSSGAPRGKVLVGPTIRARMRGASAHPTVHSAYFDKSADNLPNRLIKVAMLRLASLLRGQAGNARRLSELNDAFRLFHDVRTVLPSPVAMQRDLRAAVALIPAGRDYYRQTLAIAATVLSASGISVSSAALRFAHSSLLFDLGKVFEAYCLRVLQAAGYPTIVVRDGNVGQPAGDQCSLYEEPINSVASIKATPDIVFRNRSDASSRLVIDVKYKVCKGVPDRADLNQVVTYGVRYGSKAAALIYPASQQFNGLVRLGRVGDIVVSAYGLDLGAEDMPRQEAIMAQSLAALG